MRASCSAWNPRAMEFYVAWGYAEANRQRYLHPSGVEATDLPHGAASPWRTCSTPLMAEPSTQENHLHDPTHAAQAAQVLLKLYELRTEPALRQARAWFAFEFHPAS